MSEDPDKVARKLGHEPLTVSAQSVAYGMVVLMSSVVVALLLMGALMLYLANQFNRAARVGPVGTAVEPPPTVPVLQADQPEVLSGLRERENQLLKQYAWIDREEGVARIPIHRAMQIFAEEAAPQRTKDEDESAAR